MVEEVLELVLEGAFLVKRHLGIGEGQQAAFLRGGRGEERPEEPLVRRRRGVVIFFLHSLKVP